MNEKRVVNIVPGRAIGAVEIGKAVESLGPRVTRDGEAGELDGVRFSISSGKVDDVWIEDLRTFPGELRLGGATVPGTASLDDLKKACGGCAPVSGIKGGTFFNCASGISLGTDFAGSGRAVQLRIRHR